MASPTSSEARCLSARASHDDVSGGMPCEQHLGPGCESLLRGNGHRHYNSDFGVFPSAKDTQPHLGQCCTQYIHTSSTPSAPNLVR